MSLIIDSLAKLAEKFSQKYPGEASGVATLDGSGDVLQGPASSIWPRFSAYTNTIQSVTSGVATKVIIDTEEFDEPGTFVHDADRSGGAAESRFTPGVAGKYCIGVNLLVSANANTLTGALAHIYKNSAPFRVVGRFTAPSNPMSSFLLGSSCIVEANDTDQFEFWITLDGTSPKLNSGSANGAVYGYRIG